MDEPLNHPPDTPEGDDSDAGGGKPVAPTKPSELDDTRELDEPDADEPDS